MEQKTEKLMKYIPFGAADPITLSLEIVKNFVAVPTKSGALPQPRDSMKFIMLCQSQRLNPFAGDCYLVGYDGRDGAQFSLITAHTAILKRAEASPDFEGMESGVILSDDGKVTEREGDFHLPEEKVVGGWAKVYRKGRKPTYRRLSISQRKPRYETPFWSAEHQAEQIVKCAEADALRATFPTLLGGLYTGPEIVERGDAGKAEMPNVPLAGAVSAPMPETPQQPINVEVMPPSSDKTELERIVEDGGFTFDQFVKWGVESGNVEGADSLTAWSEVDAATAKRLIRAKVGLLKGLAQMFPGRKETE